MADLSKKGDAALSMYQLRNCSGCFYTDPDKIGTGEPCCTKLTLPDSNGHLCLGRKSDKKKGATSQSRVGRTFIVDGSPHICLEDNGERGLFQATGELVSNLPIKPTTVALFKDVQAVDQGDSQ
jgi:hypothetical protein